VIIFYPHRFILIVIILENVICVDLEEIWRWLNGCLTLYIDSREFIADKKQMTKLFILIFYA